MTPTLKTPRACVTQVERFLDREYRAWTLRQKRRKPRRRFSPPPSKKSWCGCLRSERPQDDQDDLRPCRGTAAASAADDSEPMWSADADSYYPIRVRRVTFSNPDDWLHFSLPRLSFVDIVGDPRCDIHGDDPNYGLIAEARTIRLESFGDDLILRKLLHGWRDGVGRAQGVEAGAREQRERVERER